MYEIESGIEIPGTPFRRELGALSIALQSLSIGQSIVIKRSMRSSCLGIARHLGIKVTTRSIGDMEVRVWRIDD